MLTGTWRWAGRGKAPAKVDPREYPARARMAGKLATDDGRRRYNEARPHSSLSGRTPGKVYRDGAALS